MSREAQWHIVANVPGKPLVIEDEGPRTKHLSVTNDAENVVRVLVERGLLTVGRRLFYFDSDGEPGELLIHADRFSGFASISHHDIESACKAPRPNHVRWG